MKKCAIFLFFVVMNLSLNAQTTTFDYTLVDQTYTVPPCVDSIIVDVRGGAGGSSGTAANMGGNGARVQATIPVIPGEELYIYVGQGAASSLGGLNGGGNGGSSGFGGGGASDIRRGDTAISNRIIVAGGGGGAGFCGTCNAGGGEGGGTTGAPGRSIAGGMGGTQYNGGGGGSSGSFKISGVNDDAVDTMGTQGTTGMLGKGGDGGGSNGGGGGGGYYGGGGGGTITKGNNEQDYGKGGGGGGGSSYTFSAATGVIHTRGYQAGNGQIIITPVFSTSPPTPGTIAGASSVCAGSLQTYSILPVAGADSYIWTLPSGWTGSSTSNSIDVTAGATGGTISITAANACDTSDASTMDLTVTTALFADAGPDTSICAGNSVALSASGGSDYSWSPATGLSCINCPSPIASPSVTTTYEVIVSSGSCAPASDIVQITVNALLDASVNSDTTICAGFSTVLTASGGITYSWSPSTGLSCTDCDSPVANPTTTTSYIVTVIDTNSCVKENSVVVYVTPALIANAGPDTAICAGNSVTLNAIGGANYSWNPLTDLSCADCPNPIASPSATISYEVTVTDGTCAPATDIVQVTVHQLPVANASVDTTICAGASTTLNASGGISYNWSPVVGLNNPAIATPIANPTTTTAYVVTVTDVNGCSATANITVSVQVCAGISSILESNDILVFPNPANDFLNIQINTKVKQLDVEILNIQGQIVYYDKTGIVSGNYVKQIDVSSLAKGIYYLKVTEERFGAVSKIIIQ